MTEYTARYTRAAEGRKFSIQSASVFAGRASKISTAEFAALADIGNGPSNQDLIRYVLPGLREVAAGAETPTKDWLRRLLPQAGDTAETRELKRLLH